MKALCDSFGDSFNDNVLRWAKRKFVEEIHTGFKRAKCFDAASSKEQLAILQSQPLEDQLILANVLPLGVFWDGPAQRDQRNKLPTEAHDVVEKLRSDYDREHRKHFSEHVQRIARRDEKHVKREFNSASQTGNEMIKELANQWACDCASAARGEWGLVLQKNLLCMTISLKLGRNMVLLYNVSVSDASSSRSIRFHDNYLGILGFGVGEWEVETADQFPTKFLAASEFASWHIREYERLVKNLGENGSI